MKVNLLKKFNFWGPKPVNISPSDMASWTAACREQESKRYDRIFDDPFAELLSGTVGKELMQTKLPGGTSLSWAITVRTKVFDEMITKVVTENNVTRVINLGAGFDTRPYRLDLPSNLKWIEIDFPNVIEKKKKTLIGKKTNCSLLQLGIDLSNKENRSTLFSQLATDNKQSTLVLTEGLLLYLSKKNVELLAAELREHLKCQFWIFDYIAPQLLKKMIKKWGKGSTELGSHLLYSENDAEIKFRKFGWKPLEIRSAFIEAEKLKRTSKTHWLVRILSLFATQKSKDKFQALSRYVLLSV